MYKSRYFARKMYTQFGYGFKKSKRNVSKLVRYMRRSRKHVNR